MRTKNLAIFFGIITLLGLSLVSAWGVVAPYWDGYPLTISTSQTKYVDLYLQNMAGNPEDITLRASMVDDGDGIASFVDSDLDYYVPFGSYAVIVKLKVEIPSNVTDYDREISVKFEEVNVDDEGMITLSGAVTTSFPVEINE